jgi:hypothetical protein
MTGSRLGRYAETRPAPVFGGDGGTRPEISRPYFSRKIFNRIFKKKFEMILLKKFQVNSK